MIDLGVDEFAPGRRTPPLRSRAPCCSVRLLRIGLDDQNYEIVSGESRSASLWIPRSFYGEASGGRS